MVGAARSGVRAAAAHAVDDGVKGHVNFEDIVQFDASRLHGIGLRDGAGEAVKQEAVGAVGLGDAFFDQVDDQVVADQTARFHDGFGFQAQGCARFDGGAQHVAGGDLWNAELLANESGLCSFSGARCAQQNQSHVEVLSLLNVISP